MKLYSILIRHCAPKDYKESLVGYFLAQDDTQIMNYIDKELLSGIWSDRHNEDGMCEIYDDEGNILGKETYKEKMLHWRGEFYEPNADYSDAYYGVTHYGWTEGREISEVEAETLVRLGVAIQMK